MNTTKVVLTDFDGVIRHWPSAVTASIEDPARTEARQPAADGLRPLHPRTTPSRGG